MRYLSILISTLILCASYNLQANDDLSKIALGKLIFEDTRLSEPAGQSCGSCHQADKHYSDPGKNVSPGANTTLHGNRNAPSISYAKFNPDLYWNSEEALWMGGFFLDGRARTLVEQAAAPFLNPLEMGNTSAAQVVKKVQTSNYKVLLEQVYGETIWLDADKAFAAICDAIVAYEKGPEFGLFTSKYDYYLQGKVQLSALEKKGLELFEAEDKGNCAACHPSQVGAKGEPPLFTDYSYDNLGQAANRKLLFYTLDKKHNPQGHAYIDYGLANNPHIHNAANEKGKFKVSSLRNIAATAPYLHNGLFDSLEEVVDFYNSRDVKSSWGQAEVLDNVNKDELGDLKLSDEEVKAIVAFMHTLSDGYIINTEQKSTH